MRVLELRNNSGIMWKIIFSILLLHGNLRGGLADYQHDNEWDYILFVQHWPLTICIKWMESNPEHNCTLPPNNQWTVHGVWPTKIGTDGPQYCNSSWPFNGTTIEPIESELEEYWTNIEANTGLTSFWSYEWKKHGTCAVTLDPLDDEFNYFNEAIGWAKNYSIADILALHGIHPANNVGYSVAQIHDAIKSSLGVNPVIECQVYGKPRISLLSEIRLCFNKSLNLIDCDVDKIHFLSLDEYLYDFDSDEGQILTDCSLRRPITYVNELPRFYKISKGSEFADDLAYIAKMTGVYQFLQFLIWLTL